MDAIVGSTRAGAAASGRAEATLPAVGGAAEPSGAVLLGAGLELTMDRRGGHGLSCPASLEVGCPGLVDVTSWLRWKEHWAPPSWRRWWQPGSLQRHEWQNLCPGARWLLHDRRYLDPDITRNWRERQLGAQCPEHWHWSSGTEASGRRTHDRVWWAARIWSGRVGLASLSPAAGRVLARGVPLLAGLPGTDLGPEI